MPLRALTSSGENINAFEYDSTAWLQLKAEYQAMGLRMPCCEANAIPKTSRRGTAFFAHARKGDCTTAPESDEHLYCKYIVAKAVQLAGWRAITEYNGQTPEGEEWIADVLCEKGASRIALEIQMSQQTDEETQYRQERYRKAGVRGAWFLSSAIRREPIADNRDVPAFRLAPVSLDRRPELLDFQVPLDEFVVGMLTGRLRWVIPERNQPVHIECMKDTCWACKRAVLQVYGHLTDMEIGEAPPERWIERYYTVASMSTDLDAVLKEVANDQLKAVGLNTIMKRSLVRGKQTHWPYCNRCVHCGAPQDNNFVGERLRAAEGDIDSGDLLGLVPINRIIQLPGRWVFDPRAEDTTEG